MQQKTIHISIRRPARVGTISSQHGEQGYVLLSVMLLITLMLIAMSVELPRIAQQVKRDKEEELVHRGTDYARAVKRYYHKFNSYPSSIEQLKDTNHIRFLRKEYKDPITGESEWKLVHAGEAEIKVPQQNGAVQGANPGLTGSSSPAGQPTGAAGLNPSAAGGASGSGFSGGGTGLSGGSSGFSGGGTGLSGGGTGLSGGGSGLSGGLSGSTGGGGLSGSSTNTGQAGSLSPQNAPQQGLQAGSGALQTSNIGLGNSGPQVGGGQIIGFASTSKKNSIKEFNDKDEYDQWYFVYDPRLEQVGPNQTGSANAGLIIAAPRVGSGSAQGAPGGLQGSQNPNGQNPRNQNPGNQNPGNQNQGNISGAAPASTPTPQVPQ